MKKNIKKITFLYFSPLIICSIFLFSDQIITFEGKKILLKDDGTYEYLINDVQADPVSIDSHYFIRASDEFNITQSIRFMPKFKNESNKSITAIKFSSTFKDPFGDTIYILNEGKCEQKIKPGKVSNVRLFYYWDDNEYISDQPYDKLLSLVTNKTGTIETKIIAIVFEDGEVMKIDSQ